MRSNIHLLRRLGFLSGKRRLELYPPFWLMRVKVLELSEDWKHVRLLLPLNWVSANAAGNMYGGYQASLADPIPALACLKMFPGYRVATRSLNLDFIRVGNSDLQLSLQISDAQVSHIKAELKDKGRANPCFEMAYRRSDGKVCTRICNTVAIRQQGYIGAREAERHDED